MWHLDAGTKVSSAAMKGSPISALTNAVNKTNDDVLIAADREGRIVIWNLTLYKLSPTSLPVDCSIETYHSDIDPGITALAFHVPSTVLMSGGNDGTICCWRPKTDSVPLVLTFHAGNAIWSIKCTEDYLISRDDAGHTALWVLVTISSTSGNSRAQQFNGTARRHTTAPNVIPVHAPLLCVWNIGQLGALQPLSIQQINSRMVYVAMINQKNGCSSSVWRIDKVLHCFSRATLYRSIIVGVL